MRALFSLGSGSPFYRHSNEKEVPWPHIENPLRNADEGTIQKWSMISGNEKEVLIEVDRLNRLEIPEEEIDRPLISNNLYKPNRVTYTSWLPYYEVEPEDLEIIKLPYLETSCRCTISTPDSPLKSILHELRVIIPPTAILKSISLKIGNKLIKKTLQKFEYPESTVIPLLQNYLGMPLKVETPEIKYLTIPFFFSREPGYGLPLFAFETVEVLFDIENILDCKPSVSLGLEVLHSREEVEEILRIRSHRVEDLSSKPRINNKWIYANCFWRKLPEELVSNGRARLLHDGGVDEEIKGVFWKISNPDASVKLEYHFEGGDNFLPLINFHPCAILSELELKQKILPTTSCSFLTSPELRKGYGGIMLSKYVDSLDCESGLSPRNGDLMLEFNKRDMSIEIYLLTSRDFHI